MTDTTRDLLISLASHMAYMQGQLEARHELDDPEDYYWYRESVLLRQKVADALADEPAVPEGREPAAVVGEPKSPPDWRGLCEELVEALDGWHQAVFEAEVGWVRPDETYLLDRARAVLARWGTPNLAETRRSLGDGEVAELTRKLVEAANGAAAMGWDQHAQHILRAAELLQRQALVPVSVSDALIKAECALADIAEGAPMTDEGDPLQWAERRCADTLAIIRPTMRRYGIPTSEWPPVPAHALPIPHQQETIND